MFHLRTELPEPVCRELNASVPDLTDEETRILREQIRQNSKYIAQDVARLELFIHQEKYPPQEVFIKKIRENMKLNMEENDTFRRVLWKHAQGFAITRKLPKAKL
ncbi:MAG: hypothetical protein EXS63_07785 [Candidatus Omnitrophica bacterium]|nr:hypothetical protein [Candidatus Omnitrophota bacterium]